jgi:ABC-type multidrug transport system fused ATPase/permease subunit
MTQQETGTMGRARGWRDLGRAYRLLLSMSLQTSRLHTATLVAGGALQQLVVLAAVYGSKLLVDGVVARDLGRVLLAALLWAGAQGLQQLGMQTLVSSSMTVHERVGLLIDQKLMALLSSMPGLEHHERPDYLDAVALVRDQRWQLVSLSAITGVVLSRWTALLGSVVLLVRLDPLLVMLPLCGLVAVWTGTKAHAALLRAEQANAEPGRLRRHLFTTATSAAAGKELRVFGLTHELIARHQAVATQMARTELASTWQQSGWELLGSLAFAAGYIGAVSLVVVHALQGQATPGDVVLTIGLAAQMSGALAGVIASGNRLREALAAAARYLWLHDRALASHPTPALPAAVPAQLARGISVEHLSFGYPGTAVPVLSDVSVQLSAGAMIALVGENGAGKTTLVKLLCRFYDPDAGQILVDGVELRRFAVARWRARLAAGFQDFARYEFRLRETVGVGDLSRIDDADAVQQALAQAGAGDMVAALPAGLETQLGASWEDGTDLSGGQWQKVALARALLRRAPLLVVFDEPTAALDPQTEYSLFERLAAACRSGERQGAVTLVVSHRFSTVRMADHIVVFDKGRVVEAGSHAELMQRQGLYAELFELQARAYQ